jgi:hypothetical protein
MELHDLVSGAQKTGKMGKSQDFWGLLTDRQASI